MTKHSETSGWRRRFRKWPALALCLGTVAAPFVRTLGQAPAPAEPGATIPIERRHEMPAVLPEPSPLFEERPVPQDESRMLRTIGSAAPAAAAAQAPPVEVIPAPLAEVIEEAQAGDPSANPDGDIEFQRGILKFPNGHLAPARKAREAAGQPLGYTGRTPTLPNDLSNGDFFPVDDRWRIALPSWDRYVWGLKFDGYHQNVFKGDYPICGTQDIFFNVFGVSDTFYESRVLPVNGGGVQYQNQFIQSIAATFDLFKGDNSFHPSEWTIQATPFFQLRDRNFDGTNNFTALQDGFVDVQLGILSDYYDQMNLRVGRQAFNADFRGFLFNDANDAVRFFGNAQENRIQYNAYAFYLTQKDPVTQLNEFNPRREEVYGANVFWQDPGDLFGSGRLLGLTVEANVLYNHDHSDPNREVDDVYLELAMDGRIGRFNIDAAFIQEFGHDTNNPVSKQVQNINAQMAALEVVYPMDWFFPKVSVLFASGDRDVKSRTATGFDGVFDNPNFAGAGFSYFQREALNVGAKAQLKNNFTFYPSFRNKFAKASNSVNPGLLLLNTGWDARLSSRMDLQMNFNYSEMIDASSAELASGIKNVNRELGFEANLGFAVKPLVIDTFTFTLGASAFIPGEGMKDLVQSSNTLYTLFSDITLFY